MPWWKNVNRWGLLTGLLLLWSGLMQAQTVLKSGDWIKIGVTTTGVYRLTTDMLTKASPALATADPRRLRLYGNGGAVLPQANAAKRAVDLTENAIVVTGEEDGKLDAGDAILFFGQGPHVIRFDSTASRLTHQINPYSDTTFYFLTVGDAAGLRIQTKPSAPLSGTVIAAFDDYQFHEQELTSIAKTGREWLGEYLGVNTTLSLSFSVPGLVPSTPLLITSSVVANAIVPTSFTWQINGQQIGRQSVNALSGYKYDYQGLENRQTFTTSTSLTTGSLPFVLTFDKNGQTGSQGYLNFVAVQYRRDLRWYDQPVIARLPAGRYSSKQATAAAKLWDISDPLKPAAQAVTMTGGEATWAAATGGTYLLFTESQAIAPVSLKPILNQQVRGQATPDLLIITAPGWKTEADRLAAFRRSNSGMDVLVLTTQQVFNEFGSGQADPTAIRDAVRYFYRQQTGKLKFLLLVGNATYDYRNIMGMQTAVQQWNTVPVYESRESFHPVDGFSSDDYFGFMKETDGEWAETEAGDQLLDIGVGRLPVRSLDDARMVVDKLIRYDSDKTLAGEWQSRLTLVADDGDLNIHQSDADLFARYIETQTPAYRPERLLLDAFPQEVTASGQKAPLMNKAIDEAVSDGRLIINYTGHGGESGWAEEQILTLQDIFSWRNRRLPLFVTGTCEFGRYDDPNVRSGAELALTSRLGGAIALLTTTRPVAANTNFLLNQAFYQSVFAPVNGQMPRLGDVLRLTKNKSLSGSRNRNFSLLGDPSMRLAYPKAQVAVTKINSRSVTAGKADTLRALQTVSVEGQIQDPQSGSLLTDFSGILKMSVYDKAVSQTTKGTESSPMTYKVFNSLIYAGQVTVKQGRFAIQFTVPKDIDYQFGPGRLVAYAIRSDSLMDAAGSLSQLIIGGSTTVETTDRQPPTVQLALENAVLTETPVRVAGPDVTLRAQLADNVGINLARTGLGHELTARLNDTTQVILNDYYVATTSDGTTGEVKYTFRNLPAGTYSLRVKAWDVNNNSGEGTLTFRVSDKPGLAVTSLMAYPNPVVQQATIQMKHNRPGDALDWTVQILDVSGRLLTAQTGGCTDCSATVSVTEWAGQAANGVLLPNGLYIYRLQVRSVGDGTEAKGAGRVFLSR
ncbi:type IX secretion system sortase PorU [Arsenicibacter rosenii]|uniref:Gingipain domain-containing protein n=1 Tax=Arsenicibacter rosenii TaxID=1750698 RepID=A0A1S2VQ12_9BACT|nr:type IX secretion system sortase PorU [Arsenicibacter rosenii]OIN60470.1 hypothetical protein BLX24_06525 [Arsenicibacter rosenii]